MKKLGTRRGSEPDLFKPPWRILWHYHIVDFRRRPKEMQNMNLLRAVVAIHAILVLPSTAFAETILYVCVEERAGGWEGGNIGKFKPSEEKTFIRWTGSNSTNLPQGAISLMLPQIEVSQGAQTYTMVSSNCDGILRMAVQGVIPLTRMVESCANILNGFRWGDTYGLPEHAYRFAAALSSRPKSVKYTETLMGGVAAAYVNSGTCVPVE